ncbi:small membrane protein [Klebsiella variicola]|uniref:small membrane protein n=1 Tax=Klebsiella variicola TaxID=244366 RepID=UPI00188812C9|nr:small membrane protein [Klebsiella variicola]
MTAILMIALAVVLILVAVGSLISYIKERKRYKDTFKKKYLQLDSMNDDEWLVFSHSSLRYCVFE